ncbi:MAG TPA: carboxypeptidase regulatory-like domain-containing protein [Pirellulales bacterium]|jgi:hypothetical protein|nr:carboxypeptidase regulatory-like domain-containing protein [Pirellulales bacterium]
MQTRLILCGLLVTAAGCGGSNTAPVSGRVRLDGQPLAGATVIFQPLSGERNPGPGSAGKTDESGGYTLQLMTGNTPGAILGKHKVSITAYEGGDAIPSSGSGAAFRKARVPHEYNVQTKLTFEVLAGGTANADFDLESAPK